MKRIIVVFLLAVSCVLMVGCSEAEMMDWFFPPISPILPVGAPATESSQQDDSGIPTPEWVCTWMGCKLTLE